MKKQAETLPIFTGTQINYYFVCQRKLWLFSHGLNMEHTSDTVYMGKLIGEETYSREKKEIMIDEAIRIDFIGANGIVHEVKKSNKVEQAHKFQLLYYLYYLKQKGVQNIRGEINYPKLRKKIDIALTEESEIRIKNILKDIERIVFSVELPEKKNVSFCRKCSYYELCWVE